MLREIGSVYDVRVALRLSVCFFCILFAGAAAGDEVDDYIKVQMEQHKIPELALRNIQDGNVAKTTTYGMANLKLNVPVKTETVIEIGSITKQFTAAGILLLAQEGKLSVDDKLSQHLTNAPDLWT